MIKRTEGETIANTPPAETPSEREALDDQEITNAVAKTVALLNSILQHAGSRGMATAFGVGMVPSTGQPYPLLSIGVRRPST